MFLINIINYIRDTFFKRDSLIILRLGRNGKLYHTGSDVIKPYINESVNPEAICPKCNCKYKVHGMLVNTDNLPDMPFEQLGLVCPGEAIVLRTKGSIYTPYRS